MRGYVDHAGEGEVANNRKRLTRKVHRLDRASIHASISEEELRDNSVYRSLFGSAIRINFFATCPESRLHVQLNVDLDRDRTALEHNSLKI